ncbi:hypothetical protein K431DRAFT_28450 [Polychaeton citri CBS 116435]|uniref:Copper acquisition factor BIM1-like domain-containing protein n=1 Tax=Polychaeton citri CBS 116435 TaxID=1314669 RepID=A0A9P4QBV5_9PEZI|nr:hypothetical protein K431DRAFT_28450 [Polychaeton citri CBS 116435]
MSRFIKALTVVPLLAQVGMCHFELFWPPTGVDFNEDTEGTGPCGGADIVVNNASQGVQVGRFAVHVLSTHPEGHWQFRGSLSTEAPYNFTDLTPVVHTTGIGEFCLDYLSAPSEWAGRQGVIQVIDVATDGSLYQCAPVSFESGSNSTIGSTCKNATGFSADWTSQTDLGAATTTGAGAASTSSTEPSTSTTSGLAAAITPAIGSLVGGVAAMAAFGLGL